MSEAHSNWRHLGLDHIRCDFCWSFLFLLSVFWCTTLHMLEDWDAIWMQTQGFFLCLPFVFLLFFVFRSLLRGWVFNAARDLFELLLPEAVIICHLLFFDVNFKFLVVFFLLFLSVQWLIIWYMTCSTIKWSTFLHECYIWYKISKLIFTSK
jgi:hypothetical protein